MTGQPLKRNLEYIQLFQLESHDFTKDDLSCLPECDGSLERRVVDYSALHNNLISHCPVGSRGDKPHVIMVGLLFCLSVRLWWTCVAPRWALTDPLEPLEQIDALRIDLSG